MVKILQWGGTNERPGTDHVTSGPMRGLEKNCTWWRKHTSKRIWRLYDLIGPVGPIQWKDGRQTFENVLTKAGPSHANKFNNKQTTFQNNNKQLRCTNYHKSNGWNGSAFISRFKTCIWEKGKHIKYYFD